MYHSRFKGDHYKVGFKYGSILSRNCIDPLSKIIISEERREFAQKCFPIYKEFFPEIIEEIKGMSDGLNANNIKSNYKEICSFLFTMYAFTFENKCSSFAFKTDDDVILAKNSDFLIDIEKYCDSTYYRLDNSYSFVGNTTAFIEMEDGVNENSLACALTFVYPTKINYGLNAGMIIRYILEKFKTSKEALNFIKEVPISSAQNIILADKYGDIFLIECNCDRAEVIENDYVFTANHFTSNVMIEYQTDLYDDIYSNERYNTLKNASGKYDLDFGKNLLSGKYGFICQYDRKKHIDTIWSSIYSLKQNKIYRAEGNPSRKKFKEDKRLFN